MATEKKTRVPRKEKTDFEKSVDKANNMLNLNTIEIELESFCDFRLTRKSRKNHDYYIDESISEVVKISEEMRQLTNMLKGEIWTNYTQMCRTKVYRKYKKQYGKLSEQISRLENKKKKSKEDKSLLKELKDSKKEVGNQLEALKTKYRVTETFLKEKEAEVRETIFKRVNSILGLKCVDRVWHALERVMFNNAKILRFKKQGEFPSIEAKQASKCIILKHNKDTDTLYLQFGKYKYNLKVKKNDLYVQETLSHIKEYMVNGDKIDKKNVKRLLASKALIPSYKIQFNRIVIKEIRGRIRLYLQIVYRGNTVPRRKKDGSFRHTLGKGRVAADIGTQSVAIVSKNEVILKNLAERSYKILNFEREIRKIERAMDRSKRATNPDFFNADGTIKKYPERPNDKKWEFSKNYLKLKAKRKEMHRKAALSREYAINEDINKMRALGNECILEQMSIKALQKKAKETTINEKTGRFNRKKRYGKSIAKRCPGYFIAQCKRRFESTGGKFVEVNTWTFKASQYDHKLNDCNKKQLSQRWHMFEDGTKVQRDFYSAMLLYCSNEKYELPDKKLCDKFYPKFKKMHDKYVEYIKENKIKVLNSGIKINTKMKKTA